MKEYCATEKNGDIWYVQTDGVLKYCPEKDEWIVDVPEGKSVWQDWNLAEQIESPILRARILITRETMKTPELRELVTTKQALESIYEGFKYFVVKINTLYEALDNSELEEFFHILDIYNEYRKDCQDKEPSRYWVINREEVPKIETFEQFKSKLQIVLYAHKIVTFL